LTLPDLFDSHGVIFSGDEEAYSEAIGHAFNVHVEREKIRHGLWKKYDAGAQARQMKIKADRVENNLRMMDEHPDMTEQMITETLGEIDDIINYAVFTRRKLEGTA
jgi:hypothetical protein